MLHGAAVVRSSLQEGSRLSSLLFATSISIQSSREVTSEGFIPNSRLIYTSQNFRIYRFYVLVLRVDRALFRELRVDTNLASQISNHTLYAASTHTRVCTLDHWLLLVICINTFCILLRGKWKQWLSFQTNIVKNNYFVKHLNNVAAVKRILYHLCSWGIAYCLYRSSNVHLKDLWEQ